MEDLPHKRVRVVIATIVVSFLAVFCLFGLVNGRNLILDTHWHLKPEIDPILGYCEDSGAILGHSSPELPQKEIILGERWVTAYTAREEETDDTPCITASGHNICEEELNVVATNELPLLSTVLIDGKLYQVLDRTNKRYTYVYDILMPTVSEARQWGKQLHEVTLLN